MERAVEKVRERLVRATSALNEAGVAYAVAGGNAVALWVSRVEEAAVRNTRGVDILLRRSDLTAAWAALEGAGFVYRHVKGIDAFLDGPEAKMRDAVQIVFANERVREDQPLPNPDVSESESSGGVILFDVLSLDALVRLELTVYRRKHRMHLRDMIDLEMIGEWTLADLPGVLRGRLRALLEDSEG